MEKTSFHQYPLGGLSAHVFRRIIHIMSSFILWIYFQYATTIASFFSISVPILVWICLFLALSLDFLRLFFGWTVFGQRGYEKKRISAFVWAIIGMSLVLLFAPGKQFIIPIICAYSIGDPLLGELRRAKINKIWVMLIGVCVISGIWYISSIQWPVPLWLCMLMGPITVAAEWPCLKWIDDNALMLLVPLAVLLLIS